MDGRARGLEDIYVTYCSSRKDDSLKGSGRKVTPDRMYAGARVRGFIGRCREAGVAWAILSDEHGVWFPDVEHEWYDKAPEAVTEREFRLLQEDFEKKLARFERILFYCEPNALHPLHRRLIETTALRSRIVLFSDLSEIGRHHDAGPRR